MFFSIQELERRKIRFDVEIPPGEIEFLDPRLKQTDAVLAQGTAELLGNTLGEIRVRGHLKVTMEAECDRCLEPARFPIDSDFDLFYRPAEPDAALRTQRRELAIDAGEAEIGFYEGSGLELNDTLREFILLAMPMQYVCREDCRGICPVCGDNRNIRDCGCRRETSDDRWAALKRLPSDS